MLTLDTYSQNGEKIGQIRVSEGIFNIRVNRELLHQIVVAHLANRRRGSAATKTRSEVRGSGAKLFRQKGTGRARVGDARSPTRVHGGVAFGPKPRSYRQNTPKKMLKAATLSALAAKFQDNRVTLIDNLSFEKPSTRGIIKTIKALGVNSEEKLLLVLDSVDRNIYLSCRNVRGLNVAVWDLLYAYQILWHDRLIITQEALKKLELKFTDRPEKSDLES